MKRLMQKISSHYEHSYNDHVSQLRHRPSTAINLQTVKAFRRKLPVMVNLTLLVYEFGGVEESNGQVRIITTLGKESRLIGAL